MSIDESKCTIHCEECVIACPINVIQRDKEKVVVDHDECVLCGACMIACPQDAITEIERDITHAVLTETMTDSEKINIIKERSKISTKKRPATRVKEPSNKKPKEPSLDELKQQPIGEQ